MLKWIILIFVIIVILVLIVLFRVFLYNQKLDHEFEENRFSVKFSDISKFDKSGDEDRLAPQIKEVDLLKIGHHSYAKSTSSIWLKTLNPKICIVTNNPEKTDKRTLRRITRVTHSPILITGREDGIIAKIDDGGVISYF